MTTLPQRHEGAKTTTSTKNNFNLQALSKKIAQEQSLHARIVLAHGWVAANLEGSIALTSSFGVQATILLNEVNKTNLAIPVISVDIQEEKYEQQRLFRDSMHDQTPLIFHIFSAENDNKKVESMDNALHSMGVGATISGLRATQTKTRAEKGFVERNPRNDVIEFNLLLDWTDANVDDYIQAAPEGLRHPSYAPGVQSKGGLVLKDGEEKTECGLHEGYIEALIKAKNEPQP